MWNLGGKAAVSSCLIMSQMAIQKQDIAHQFIILEKPAEDLILMYGRNYADTKYTQ